MDRGRAGGFVTDNNLALKLTKEKQFKEHLQRLEKIKVRKAGSSNTLDNNPPVIVKATLSNPRKIALRNEFNEVVTKENKYAAFLSSLFTHRFYYSWMKFI
jgi:hypothetical protein